MTELPIFLCYRQDDGARLAERLHGLLRGRTLSVVVGSLHTPATLSVYYDQAAPAVSDWQLVNLQALEQAKALILLCTPGATRETGPEDFLYREIRWWLEHRREIAPILVTTPDLGERCVPAIVHERWPHAQVIKVPVDQPPMLPDRSEMTPPEERAVGSLLAGIRRCIEPDGLSAKLGDPTESGMPNFPGLYTWEKDRHFRYVRVNENYSRAAGFSSPHEMVGKTDDDMPWRSFADFFRAGDQRVFNAAGPPRFNVQEKEIMVDRVADILVTEEQLQDRRGECVGLTGYFVDVTGVHLSNGSLDCVSAPQGLSLGPEFGNESLTAVEAGALLGMLQQLPRDEIAENLGIERAELESHTTSIKRKLQCTTDGDVLATAIRSGLPIILFGLASR